MMNDISRIPEHISSLRKVRPRRRMFEVGKSQNTAPRSEEGGRKGRQTCYSE